MLKLKSRDDSGSAFVELALVLPLLSLVLIGAAELGRIAYFAIEVSNAARAGAAYGSQSTGDAAQGANGNYANIRTAAQADAPDLTITFPTGSPATYEDCEQVNSNNGSVTVIAGPTIYTSPPSCPTSTTTGITNNIVNYVKVSTQATVTTMFHYPGIPTSFTLNGFAEMRVVQ